VCVVNKFLDILKRDLGRERRMPQVLQEAIERVDLKMNDNVVFLENTVQRVWCAGC